MKLIYALVVVIAFAGLGYLAGRGQGFREGFAQGFQQVPPKSEEPVSSMNAEDEKNWREFKDRLQGISPEQIREYLRTQNAEEKLKKADEILGKIMQALVVSFGFRLNPEEVAQLNGSPAVAHSQPEPREPEVVETKPEEKTPTKEAQLYQRLKRQIQVIGSEEQAQKVLAELPADFSRIQSASPLTRQQINQLRGHFEGTLTYLKDGSQVRTTIDFSGRVQGRDKVTGQAKLVVYNKEGRAISTGTSNGDLNDRYSGTPVSIFIESGGDYFELVYFQNLGAWMGNFLESKKGQLTKTGTLVYRR